MRVQGGEANEVVGGEVGYFANVGLFLPSVGNADKLHSSGLALPWESEEESALVLRKYKVSHSYRRKERVFPFSF